MPNFLPFKALRPKPELIGKVSAKSTDFNSQELLVDALRNNPYSFHHVTKNHLNYSGAFQEPEKFLPFAAKFMEDMMANGTVFRDKEDSFYIYEQIRGDGASFKGIIGLSAVEDYRANHIKKHEEIRPSRVRFMVELFKSTKVLGEPTLLAYKSKDKLDTDGGELIYDFTSVDQKNHKIFRISDPVKVEQIKTYFKAIESFYIADGHHRSASTEQFNRDFPELNNKNFLCLLMDEDDLEINSFHRVIRSALDIEVDEVLNTLSEDFLIDKLDTTLIQPENKGEIGFYTGDAWYKLTYKKPSEHMDVSILEEKVVRKIFHIKDSRTDSQISFIPNTNSGAKLLSLVDTGAYNYAFTLKPCEFKEIRKISDEESTLPPKSTYIEPKLRAGMLIQAF